MAFQLSYFKSWKMMLWKCCPQYASKFGKLSSGQDWKRSIFIPIPKKGNAKECSNYCTIALISHPSKVMLKFSNPGSNSTWTMNFQMFKLDLEKAEKSEIKLPTLLDHRKRREFQKNIYFCFIYYTKAFDYVDPTNCGKFLKTLSPYLPSEKSVCRSRSNS